MRAVFNRPKDWVDIDSMLALNAGLDVAEGLRWVARIAGDEDSRATTASLPCSPAADRCPR